MKNWRTTLAGWGIGALYTFINGGFSGANWKQSLVGIGLGVLGSFAKDFNVTGGTTPANDSSSAANSAAAGQAAK